MKQTEYKTATATIKIIEPNIFHNYIHENTTVTIEDVNEVKNINLELSKGTPYALLISKGEFSVVPADVRRLISSKDFVINTIAKALLTNSIADKLIGQFYIKIDKPVIKTKLFTDKNKAILWLKEEIEKYNLAEIRKAQ